MVEISKHLFEEECMYTSCHTLYHRWHPSCLRATIPVYRHSVIGSAKFYFVVHLVQNLMRGKNILNKNELKKIGEYYIRSTLLGALISGSVVTFGCFIRWLLGNRFTYYTYFFLPCTLNGVFITLEPPQRRGLVVNLFSSMLLEYFLRLWERSGYIRITTTKKTLMFMIGSALMFYLMRLEGDRAKRTPLLWLFTPEKVKKSSDNSTNVCPHNEECSKYILKGAASYFGVGLALSLAQTIFPKFKTPIKALSSLRWSHMKLALFFGSYIGIYRSVICYLCRKHGTDSALYALPAGFLSGLSFIFKPSLGIALASLTGAFKLYSTNLYEKKILPDNIPLPIILYCICQGTLFHARMMHPEVCPSYMFRLMKSVSNGNCDHMHSSMLKTINVLA